MRSVTFFSYQQLLQQGSWISFLRYGLIIVGAMIIVGYLVFHLRHRDVTKYRDLFVIVIIAVLLLIGIQVVDIRENQSATNNSRAALTLLKSIAKARNVPRSEISLSSTSVYDGMLVQFYRDPEQTYRLTLDTDGGSYQLTKTTLIDETPSKD